LRLRSVVVDHQPEEFFLIKAGHDLVESLAARLPGGAERRREPPQFLHHRGAFVYDGHLRASRLRERRDGGNGGAELEVAVSPFFLGGGGRAERERDEQGCTTAARHGLTFRCRSRRRAGT